MNVVNLTLVDILVRDVNGDVRKIPVAEGGKPRLKWSRLLSATPQLDGLSGPETSAKIPLIAETGMVFSLPDLDPGTLYIVDRLVKETLHARNVVWPRKVMNEAGKWNGEFILILGKPTQSYY